MILVLVPFWSSILVRTYAWMVLLGREGIVNQFLLWLGVIEEPLRLLNTTFAVYVAMVHMLLPFMILPLYGVMRGLDENLLRAAEGPRRQAARRLPPSRAAALAPRHLGGLPPRLHPRTRLLHHARTCRRARGTS